LYLSTVYAQSSEILPELNRRTKSETQHMVV